MPAGPPSWGALPKTQERATLHGRLFRHGYIELRQQDDDFIKIRIHTIEAVAGSITLPRTSLPHTRETALSGICRT
jgi:hypothetical protein